MADIKNFGLAGIGPDVQLGKKGVRLASANGTLTVSNAVSGMTQIRAADPVVKDDLTTRRFFEANSISRSTLQVEEGVAATIAISGTIIRITAIVTTAFTNPATLIYDATTLLGSSDFSATQVGIYEVVQMIEVDGTIEFIQTGTGSGAITIIIEYLAT